MTQPPYYWDVAYWDANGRPVRYDELPPVPTRPASMNEKLIGLLIETVDNDHD